MAMERQQAGWLETAASIFGEEYLDQKDFVKKFDSKLSLYQELANRVLQGNVAVRAETISGMSGSFVTETETACLELAEKHIDQVLSAASYEMMYQAHVKDAANGDDAELMSLINQYEELKTGR